MMNMKVGLEKRPLTVKQVDTLTAAILRKGITMNELARKISRTPAECSLIIGRKTKLDKFEVQAILDAV